MKKILSLIYILCFSALTSSFAQNKNIKDLYEQLDQAIEQSQYYINQKESRITKIKKQSRQGHTPQQLLTAYYKLYEEYKAYQSDSSIYYIHQAIDLAKRNNMKSDITKLRSLLALQYSTSGAFTEALHVLQSIDKKTLNNSNKKDYYIAFYHVYGELGFTNINIDTDLSQEFYSKQDCYRDTLFSILSPNSEDYLMRKEVLLTSQNKLKEALKINDIRLSKCKKGSHEYGIVAYYRYLIYRSLKDEDMVKYWLLQSAICDVKCAINDQASLWILAEILSKEKRCGTLIQIHQLFVERQQEILYSHTQLADISSAWHHRPQLSGRTQKGQPSSHLCHYMCESFGQRIGFIDILCQQAEIVSVECKKRTEENQYSIRRTQQQTIFHQWYAKSIQRQTQ